jgi:hypothetical protein
MEIRTSSNWQIGLLISVLVVAQMTAHALAHENLYHVECGESPLRRYKDLAVAIGKHSNSLF